MAKFGQVCLFGPVLLGLENEEIWLNLASYIYLDHYYWDLKTTKFWLNSAIYINLGLYYWDLKTRILGLEKVSEDLSIVIIIKHN